MSYWSANQTRLSPAYDLVCSRLVIPREDESALMINGKRNKIKRKDFDLLGDYFSIPLKVRFGKFIGKIDVIKDYILKSCLDEQERESFIKIVQNRYDKMELF